MQTIFITGASGALGQDLARRLSRGHHLILLRHRSDLPELSNVSVIRGDITRPRLGLGRRDYEEVTMRTRAVLHCAAATSFSMSAAAANSVNVEGTRQVFELAAACPKLEKIGVLSTTYVAGTRRGLILEDELRAPRAFVNEYEHSKYEMERLIREESKRLPIAVYRSSTILGRAKGEIVRLGAVHRAIRLLHRGLVPMIPGTTESPVDLISMEFAARAVEHLFRRRFEPGMTYHIAAAETALPLADFLRLLREAFGKYDPRWVHRQSDDPPIVPLRTFRLLDRTAQSTGDPFLRSILSAMRTFVPQLAYPKVFDDREAQKGLAGSRVARGDLELLCRRVVRRLVAE